MDNETEISDFYVVVLGVNESGMAAGLLTAESGSEVLIIERTGVHGGHTLKPQRMFPATMIIIQIKYDLDSPTNQRLKDMMNLNRGEAI